MVLSSTFFFFTKGVLAKSSSLRDHKIGLMEDHGFKIFAATLHALLFMWTSKYIQQCTNSGVESPYTEVMEFVYLSPVTVTGSNHFIITFCGTVGGDQRFSTPLNRGDHPFVHHLHRGDQWKDAGKFAQFSRPPAPVVNDISLSGFCIKCIFSILSPKNWNFTFFLRLPIIYDD